MARDFGGVFTRIGMRSAENTHQDFVHDFPVVHEVAKVQGVGFGTEQGLTAAKQAVGDVDGIRTRGAYDAYGSTLGGGDGADGGGHRYKFSINN